MARKKSDTADEKSPSSKSEIGPGTVFARRVALWGVVAALGATMLWAGYGRLKRIVEARYATPAEPPVVVIKDRPVWMNDYLADRIARVARPISRASAFDHKLLVEVHDQLLSDPDVAPWIEKVNRIRRVYGGAPGDTVELDVQFRAPVALVRWNDGFWMVDSKGVKLPERFEPEQVARVVLGQDGKLVLRVIDGVRNKPRDPGMLWEGADLQAGLELMRVLHDKPYAQEIVKVDVANFAGRRDPAAAHLTLVTRYNTQIRWGRPVSSQDYIVEVSAVRKLEFLERIHAEFGQVDARQPWVDLRFDRPMYPTARVPATNDALRAADSR